MSSYSSSDEDDGQELEFASADEGDSSSDEDEKIIVSQTLNNDNQIKIIKEDKKETLKEEVKKDDLSDLSDLEGNAQAAPLDSDLSGDEVETVKEDNESKIQKEETIKPSEEIILENKDSSIDNEVSIQTQSADILENNQLKEERLILEEKTSFETKVENLIVVKKEETKEIENDIKIQEIEQVKEKEPLKEEKTEFEDDKEIQKIEQLKDEEPEIEEKEINEVEASKENEETVKSVEKEIEETIKEEEEINLKENEVQRTPTIEDEIEETLKEVIFEEKKTEKNLWDDDDIELDEEDDEVKNVENFEVLPDKLEDKSTKSNIVSSGWDDTEFSDIDEDDGELIKKEEIIEKKPSFEPEVKETKQQQQQQKSWNWYKFGSSILSTATNLTSQLG